MKVRVNELRQMLDDFFVPNMTETEVNLAIEKYNFYLEELDKYIVQLEEDNAFLSRDVDQLEVELRPYKVWDS